MWFCVPANNREDALGHRAVVLKLEPVSPSPEGQGQEMILVKRRTTGTHPRGSGSVGLEWVQESAFLTTSHELLLLGDEVTF